METAGTIPQDLKDILKVAKYDNIFALSQFNEKDLVNLTQFMQDDLHELLPEEDLEQYYGLFKKNPKKFKFLGGDLKTIWHIVDEAKKILSTNKRALLSSGPTAKKPRLSQPVQDTVLESDTDTEDSILKCKENLELNISNWMKIHLPEATAHVTARVVDNGLGSYAAQVKCPLQGCKYVGNISKNKNANWATSNFYKHLKTHTKNEDQGSLHKYIAKSADDPSSSQHEASSNPSDSSKPVEETSSDGNNNGKDFHHQEEQN